VIVVDTNVIAGFWIRGSQSTHCDHVKAADPDWHSPFLWRSEFRNALAGYIRRGTLTIGRALDLIHEAEAMMRNRAHAVESARILSLISASTCSAYELEFVALAQTLGVTLVTNDAQVLREFPDVARSLLSF
jgi:predicted nucleic acid-binding protein